jgi:hypothetical protein
MQPAGNSILATEMQPGIGNSRKEPMLKMSKGGGLNRLPEIKWRG